jgi:hypothetical protein
MQTEEMQIKETRTTDEYDKIVRVVELYMEGSAKGDLAKLKEAFHENAHMFGSAGGARLDVPIAEFFRLSVAHPGESPTYKARLLSVNQVEDAAVAVVAEDGFWGTASFIDFFSLSRFDGTWKIVNKTFAHTGGEIPPM